jgi:DNA polymerase I-like protein with 3'-5' exonuclease and polymerase domains
MNIKSQLMDLRTSPDVWAKFVHEMGSAETYGLDCETQDENRHAGLIAFNNKKRHVFDHRRTVMTGFSIYPEGSDTAYYFNLAHADTHNRLPTSIVAEVLAMKPKGATWVAHNAPFEIVMFKQCLDIDLEDVVCSLQLAVSDHGPDEYAIDKFLQSNLDAIKPLVPDIIENFRNYDGKKDLNSDQQFTLGQFIGKTSTSAFSYNGIVKEVAWGFSLKKLTKSIWNYDQETYEDVLAKAGATHMGELTGDQVCAYGADDAYWAVKNYQWLLDKMMRENPAALVTFLEGENPMIYVYADAWREGLRVNQKEIYEWRDKERENYAAVMRELKAEVRKLLPFKAELDPEMVKWQKWYEKSGPRVRQRITAWANSADETDSFRQCNQLSNPIGNAWNLEKKLPVAASGTKLNLGHYYGMRTLLHDLMGHKLVRVGGDISTNSEARGRMLQTFEGDETRCTILKLLTRMSQIEQSMKLYLTPYTQLMDPETGCLYSVISSMLASRRMAAKFPNPMQLAKRGESTYVRGFYLPDNDNHVVISADWSSVELVEIGEFSGDPEFAKVFGQLPYGDLHSGAAVDILAVSERYAWLTEDEFVNELKRGRNPMNRDLRDFNGREMLPKKWVSFMRTEIGKGANFNYWYSGALATVAEKMGFTADQMWAAGDRYRERFSVAEAWRLQVIADIVRDGFVTLPDGHRRVRFEATNPWYLSMRRKFADVCSDPAVLSFADLALSAVQRRAKNQAVNSMIQGMCARLAKDTCINMRSKMDPHGAKVLEQGKSRFMLPIHDELVYSVHRDYVPEFIPMLRETMCDHPKYIKTLPLHCTVALGRTFKPWDGTPFSQIELDEAPVVDGVIGEEFDGKELPMEKINDVIEWMMAA